MILASTSPYRRELLARLQLPFRYVDPGVVELARSGENGTERALRLAAEKSAAIAAQFPEALVIGSDQVAWGPDGPLHKPGDAESAVAQLMASRGRSVSFFTGISLQGHARQLRLEALVPVTVRFRSFTESEARSYIEKEQPLDCAGSFRCEGLGIALFESLDTPDSTALIGLPLLALCGLLREAGVEPLTGAGIKPATGPD